MQLSGTTNFFISGVLCYFRNGHGSLEGKSSGSDSTNWFVFCQTQIGYIWICICSLAKNVDWTDI